MNKDKTLVLGHRGAMGLAPENTAVSFERALDEGADGVEFDVQMTRDGELVVIHDQNLERVTGKKSLVKDITLKEIKELDVGSHFQDDFAGQEILTLDETLDIVKKCSVINIEIKNGPVIYPKIEEKVISTVEKYGISDRIIISSFNHYTVRKFKELSPKLTCGVLHMAGLYQPWKYAKMVGADAVHPYGLSITPKLVEKCQAEGVMVNVFGVNEERMLKKVIEAGPDMVITDYPAKALKLLGRK
jgi:glycerophosphoryl diester phosphodiesterase